MNLILSNKVAERLKKEFNLDGDCTPRIDNWRIDSVELGKRSIFIITNEPTLYTCISSFRSGFNGIIERLAMATKKQSIDPNEINYLKSKNRSLVSSMNNIKVIISQRDRYIRGDNETYEKIINQIPFQYLSFSTPAELYLPRFSEIKKAP
jgi:hypothetical protein